MELPFALLIDFLNSNSGAITAICTAGLVIITAVYVWHTGQLVSGGDKTNKHLRELADAMKVGQELQNEANLMKFYEVMGNTKLNKPGLDRAFPKHYDKWKESKEPSNQ